MYAVMLNRLMQKHLRFAEPGKLLKLQMQSVFQHFVRDGYRSLIVFRQSDCISI